MNTAAQLNLLRLASPALPIGGFSYSQGLENAIERGWVHDADSLVQWLEDALFIYIGQHEAPLAYALFTAVAQDDGAGAETLHAEYLATRETAELLAETRQMGYSLLRLLAALEGDGRAGIAKARSLLDGGDPCALPMAWACAAQVFGLAPGDALAAYLWAWLENQVAAAIKAVPLGQQLGQGVLDRLQPLLVRVLDQAPCVAPDAWSNFAPGLALVSSWHEAQYSRLFRS